MDAQDVCLALGISKRCLQNYRDNGLVPYSNIGGKFFYRETDIQEILLEVRKDNNNALHAYHKMGFYEAEDRDEKYLMKKEVHKS